MGEETYMKIFIWRHSKKFSSWSMFNEPHIYKDNYMQVEAVVLASSKEEALDLLRRSDDKWDVEELNRIEPLIFETYRPCVVAKLIYFG